MKKNHESLPLEGRDQDLNAEGLADEMLVEAMLKGRYQDSPEGAAQRVARACQALEACPRSIPWHWQAGLSTAAAAIVVLGLILVLGVPQEVQADLAPILAVFDMGDKTYQIDIARDTQRPGSQRGFKGRRWGRQAPFKSPRRSMTARRLDGASLNTRARNYVLTCRGPMGGSIVKGFDGRESWLVTPWGQSKRGQDHSLLQEDLPEHISSLLFLDLRDILHTIQEKYVLSGPSRGTAEDAQLQLEYYIAQRTNPQDRIPKCIELWVDTQTKQLHQIQRNQMDKEKHKGI